MRLLLAAILELNGSLGSGGERRFGRERAWWQSGEPMRLARRNRPIHFAAVIHMSCAKGHRHETWGFEISEQGLRIILDPRNTAFLFERQLCLRCAQITKDVDY